MNASTRRRTVEPPPQFSLEPYLRGEKLFGDDFSPSEILAWHDDEREAYSELSAKSPRHYRYGYHALNECHGYRHLRTRTFTSALGFGSAYGHELDPIAENLEHITIVDPSDKFARRTIGHAPVTYVKPSASGKLLFPDCSFDLITCLGVLHHIPNVSFVVRELSRCLKRNGYMLLREPIVSLGDWRYPRPHLTARERGIPLGLLRRIILESGLCIVRESLCVFPIVPKLWRFAGGQPYNSRLATRLDRLFCNAFRWNLRYHATSTLHKLRPTSAYYLITKQ